jgi:CDGSH-type Zn-finger protein
MSEPAGPRIRVLPNGPYRVTGAALARMRPLVDARGDRVDWQWGPELEHDAAFDLCRCGASRTHPFCDGSERENGFDGTETASRNPYQERAFRIGDGPVTVTDDPSICSSAGFCEAFDTDVWTLAEATADPEARARLVRMVKRCPSGRLAYLIPPSTDPVEEDLQPEVAVVDDGPYWVRGGVPIEAADGFEYEVRNRATLCRCGRSRNKPFCDGSHSRVGFRDPA